MFPLAGASPPASADALGRALEEGIREILTPAAGKTMVHLDATGFPHVAQLEVDATGATVVELAAAGKGGGSGLASAPPKHLRTISPAITAAQFAFRAMPLLFRAAKINVDLSATNVRFEFAKDDRDRLFLVPATSQEGTDASGAADGAANGGGEGQIRVEATQQNLEALLRSVLEPLAGSQGVGLEKPEIQLNAEGPRTLRAEIAATAKKLFVKARVRVRGRLEIDDALVASVDELQAEGEGFIGDMAKSILQPKLRSFNGSRWPLTGFSLGGLRLRDVQMDTRDGLVVSAKVGA